MIVAAIQGRRGCLQRGKDYQVHPMHPWNRWHWRGLRWNGRAMRARLERISSGIFARSRVTRIASGICALAMVVGLLAWLTPSLASSWQALGAHAQGPKPVVTKDLKHDKSPSLKTLKVAPPANTNAKDIKNIGARVVPHQQLNAAAKSGTANVQSTVVTTSMPSTQANFEGVGNLNHVLPPDTNGAVGPNDYVQMINLSFAIYSKTGTLLYGPVPNNTLWQGFGGLCESNNDGDPVALYDEAADRWFMSQFALDFVGTQGYHECIAVSQTGDPTGAWYRYDFLYSQTLMNDYPKFGIWPDAYYMSANEFPDGQYFAGVGVVAFERARMLAGQSANEVYFHIGDGSGRYSSLLPADAEGQALGFSPPAGAPDPFLMLSDDAYGFDPTDRIDMWDFHVDWTNPTFSTFGNNGAPNRHIDTAPFDSNLCNFNQSCIPQPGTSVGLDTLSHRLMYRAAYRNFGSYQAIALNHTVNVGTATTQQAGIRWYKLTNPGSGWTMGDQGTYAPDSDNRWMGSAALDASGDLAVGFSVSSTTTYPSIRIAGRLVGDPAGQLAQGETAVIAGGGSQTSKWSRWGDYSAMTVDPTDGCTFWYTSEYMATTSSANWQTRIASFKFPGCTAGAHGKITGIVTDASTNQPIAGATVTTAGAITATTTTASNGSYSLTLPVGAYDLTFAGFGYATQTVTGLQVTNGGTTTKNAALGPVPFVTVSGAVTDGSGHGYPLYARIDVNGRPGGPVFTNPGTGRYSVNLPENNTWAFKVTATLPSYQTVNATVPVGTGNVTQDVAIPVMASPCTAPGYSYGTPLLSQSFDGATMPADWTVIDNVGNGQVWQIGDPANAYNGTGGSGSYTAIDSSFYGAGNHQDTILESPAFDASSLTAPVLQFANYYEGATGQTATVDLSMDGGTTWSTIWSHGSDSVFGPDLESIAIPQAAGKTAVRIRFHFTASNGWRWEVDDVAVLSCVPKPGGLVVGTVDDANTNLGITGATVIDPEVGYAYLPTTVATPDDPTLGGGYYWIFSSLTGAHPFRAAKKPYQTVSQTVNVAANGTTRADFSLPAGRITISPSSVSISQVLGSTTNNAVTFSNTGGAPATVTLYERSGAFQLLQAQGAPLKLSDAPDGTTFSPAFRGAQTGGSGSATVAGPSTTSTWSLLANYPVEIFDNSADTLDGQVYSVGGSDANGRITNNGYVYNPAADTWATIASMPVARDKPAVAAVNGKLYVSGGWDAVGNPIARTDVYDPASNTWSTVAPNPVPSAAPGVAVVNGKIYLVGGCLDGGCSPSTATAVYDPVANSWTTVAAYPQPVSWEGCGGINGKVYCAGGVGSGSYTTGFVYDPAGNSWSPIAPLPIDLWGGAWASANGLLVLSGGVTNSSTTVTNQGYAYDPASDSWSALPNAPDPDYRDASACGFYTLGGLLNGLPLHDLRALSGLNQCVVTDVPWMSESATTLTLQPGQSANVTVTLAATTAAQVSQPGTYTAQFGVGTDTPYTVSPINVTMTVYPPNGWGKFAGTVSGKACNGTTSPLMGAQVQASGVGFTFSMQTDKNGNYGFWVPAASNPYVLSASRDGYLGLATKVTVKPYKIFTINFILSQSGC
jgi:N-acetylneuraminic acid mutarotase